MVKEAEKTKVALRFLVFSCFQTAVPRCLGLPAGDPELFEEGSDVPPPHKSDTLLFISFGVGILNETHFNSLIQQMLI